MRRIRLKADKGDDLKIRVTSVTRTRVRTGMTADVRGDEDFVGGTNWEVWRRTKRKIRKEIWSRRHSCLLSLSVGSEGRG